MEDGIAAASVGRGDVEDDATAEGRADARVSREAAHHEAVAGKEGEAVAFDVHSAEAGVTGSEGLNADQRDPRSALGGPGQELDRRGVLETGLARHPTQLRVEHRARRDGALLG